MSAKQCDVCGQYFTPRIGAKTKYCKSCENIMQQEQTELGDYDE